MSEITNDILKGVNEKNCAAWGKLYSKFFRSLCSYSFNIVHDGDVSKDVVQDVLMRMWQSSVVFKSEGDLLAYLYRAVYNNSVIYMRNSGTHATILTNVQREYSLHRELELDADMVAGIVSEEVIRELHTSIAELPRDRQEVLKLSIEGCTGVEIAKLLGISINTVKTQKLRGYRFLRERLRRFVYPVAPPEVK